MALTKISTGMLKQDAASSDLNIDAGTLYLDVSNNRVGVANTSPAYTLDISGSSTIARFNSSNTNAYLRLDTTSATSALIGSENGRLIFSPNSTTGESLSIASNGRLGIGTTSPNSELEVYNSTEAELILSNSGTFKLGISTDGTTARFRSYNATYGVHKTPLSFNLNSGELIGAAGLQLAGTTIQTGNNSHRIISSANDFAIAHTTNAYKGFRFLGNVPENTLVVESNGRVGIGTDSPAATLHVDNGSGSALYVGLANNIYYRGTEHIWQSQNNTAERMRIDSNGRVGIGVTSVSSSLHVYHATDNNLARFQSGDATAHIQFRDSNTTYIPSLGAVGDDLTFSVGNGAPERMRIDSSGNVGIGTASPGTKLHVTGITTFDGDGASRAEITSSTANSVVSLDIGGFNGTPSVARDIRFLTNVASNNKAERMRITNGGNVGIGTASPLSKFDIYHGSTLRLMFTTTGGTDNFVTSVNGANNAYTNLFLNGAVVKLGTGGTERMRIDSSGHLLVATTNPSNTVAGFRAYSGGNVGIAIAGQCAELNRLSSDGSILGFQKDGTTVGSIQTNSGRLDIQGASNTVRIQSGTSLMQVTNGTQITFETAGSERVRIADNGKVGIGTNSPGFKLEIADDTDGAVDLLRLRNSDSTYSQSFDFSLDTGKNLSITGASGNGGVIIKPGSYGTEIRRDAGGALGAKLVLRNYSNTAGSYVRLQLAPTQAGVDDRNVTIQGENVDGNNNMAMVFKTSAGASPAEAMRIDQNGNLLVGKQSAAFTSDGHEIRKDSYAGFTRDGGLPLLVNRRTSSGDMIEFYKDSTSIGTIGSIGGANLYINSKGSGGYGRLKANGTDIGVWWSNGFYPGTDASYDLGVNTASGRWRNLFLSGAFYSNNGYITSLLGINDTNTYINFAGSDQTRFYQGGTERARFDGEGLRLATGSSIVRDYRTLYNGSATANTVQYIKLYDRDSTTAGSENLHFYMRGFNHSEYSVEVKIFIPTYSGFTTSYGTMDAGQGIEVEIICGGLSSQGNVFQEIIEVANLSSTTDNTEIWLKTQVPHATTGISISEAADSTDTLIPTGNGSGWTTTAPSNQHRVFPIKIGKTINGIHTTRDSKLGIGTSTPAGSLHLRDTAPHLYIQSDDGQSAKLLFGDATDNSRGGIEYMSTDDMRFMNNNLSTVMTLRYTGNVGIGTTSPTNKLHIVGNTFNTGQVRANTGTAATPNFTIDGGAGMFKPTSNVIGFSTNSTERLRIASGNPYMFLGHTGHGWGTFHAVAQIGRTGVVATYDSGANQQTIIANNTYYGGSGYTSIEGTTGASYMNVTQGQVRFYTAPSITAGSAQTFTQRLKITNAGNVGIGEDSPAGPLHVTSTGHISYFEGTGGNVSLQLLRSDVSGAVDFGDIQFANSTGIAAKINSRGEGGSASGNLTFQTRNTSGTLTERMRIQSGGKVGIGGTVMDGQKLNIEGWAQSNTLTPANAWLVGRGTGGDGLAIGTAASSPYATWFQSGYLPTMGTSNHYALSFNPHGGNVGIGTTSPSETLELTRLGKIGFGMDGNYGVRIGYFDDTSGVHGFHVDTKHAGTVTSETRFIVRADTGRIGIGNKNPGETLHIGSGQSNYIRIHNAASGDVASGLTITRGNSTGFALYDNPSDDTTTFNAIGNMNFRTDNSSYRLYISDIGRVGINTNSLGADGLTIGTATNGNCEFDLNNTSTNGTRWRIQSDPSGDLRIENKTDSTIPFVIEDTGNVGIGTTNPSSNGIFSVACNLASAFMGHFSNTNASGYGLGLNTISGNTIFFYHNSSSVGSITTTSTYTSYATTSDVRLKENIIDAPSASEDIDAIQVRSFDWKADGSHQKYGMVAQELAEVIPSAVNVPEEEERMQSVDYSKLVPLLVKEVQSLRARVAELEGDK